MRKLFMFVLAGCLALFAVGVSAQTLTTGSLEGTVTDSSGAAVPGVTITATRTGGSPKTATSNNEGRYAFPQLEPGKYKVTVEATKGFGKFEDSVDVSLGRTSDFTVQLAPAGATATVNVTAGAGAALDVTANTTGTNVSTEQFSNFPTQRTVQSLYTIAPTVSRSGLRDSSGRDRDPSVGGSSGPENNYILDGVGVSDPAFGGSGGNLPFEFVQEIEIKTGAYGAEYGKSTGGIFNVITKSGTNDIRGDAFGYFTTKGLVRDVKTDAIPRTGSAPNGFSEIDAGIDIGGPIKKDKLYFFGAFNPQRRQNYFLTQTFHNDVHNKVTTPFYSGKITWQVNQNNVFNFSTFGDFTKQEGFLFGGSGFGANPSSFRGEIQTGGTNYAGRLNSTITPNWIGEFSAGLHFQRANTIPDASVANTELITDNFAVLSAGGAVLPDVESSTTASNTLRNAFVNGTGGSIQRNFVRQGFGLVTEQDRNRYEAAARLQNVWGKNTIKYGVELTQNRYRIDTHSTGPTRNYGAPLSGIFNGMRITNGWGVCQGNTGTKVITCPSSTFTTRAAQIIGAGEFGTQYTSAVTGTLNDVNVTNPILILSTVSVRDFRLTTHGEFSKTNTESFYIQDDYKLTKDIQLNLGLRWDYQQSNASQTSYFKLNNFHDNMQPRLGIIWDFTHEGRGKIFANYAKFVETPLPLDLNVRAGGDSQQIDFNIRVSRLNAPAGSTTITDFGNLGGDRTPIDLGLKPQTVNEYTAGIEYNLKSDFTVGFRGIYRAQQNVIEDGSFDDGTTYFIFNPGRRGTGNQTTTEDLACGDPTIGCFGPARRYYRALEFTATKRFSNNWQLISSYVFSSLIGNYEGLFRNDNGQSDPNITSLFDLVSLLKNTYGRLPNDRPHQLKLDASYRWPFKLMTSASFRAQSGIPFDQLIPHPVYGNNEGFAVPRGTAINPITGRNRTPSTYNLDLGAYYPIQMGENRQLRLQLDWFNALNFQRAIRQDTTFQINSGATGIPPVSNPFYGTGTIFQFPSSLRLGVKFQF
ncbi:MAG TPA: TonB-dependent receptor [Pyrinomonadaceae bacterium]|nr:TonB-dependent receptor [Pyrinomonadaceae bacterium]